MLVLSGRHNCLPVLYSKLFLRKVPMPWRWRGEYNGDDDAFLKNALDATRTRTHSDKITSTPRLTPLCRHGDLPRLLSRRVVIHGAPPHSRQPHGANLTQRPARHPALPRRANLDSEHLDLDVHVSHCQGDRCVWIGCVYVYSSIHADECDGSGGPGTT